MVEPDSFNKPHPLVPDPTSPIQLKPSKSYSVFLCKSLFIALLLVVLPLFPSKAPEFINQTILTKFWELLHLLFIGIVVSYGLFGRKNTEKNNESRSKLDDSQTCLSGILYIPSIFEDRHENSCGYDEKRTIQAWNPSESMFVVNNGIGSSVVDDWNNPRSLVFQNGLENPSGSDEKRVSQTWNSQYYFQGESMLFVSRENCVLDEWGKPKSFNDDKPLGLPVRSLRSKIVDHDIHESMKENGSSSDSKGSCKNSEKIRNDSKENGSSSDSKGSCKNSEKIRNDSKENGSSSDSKGSCKNSEKIRNDSKDSCKNSENFRNGTKIRGLKPINLDEKFKETDSIPWQSRSSRMEVREDHKSSVKPPSHSRPLSVGGFEFDHLKSQSFWSPIFSQTNAMPSPPKKVSPDSPKSKMADLERKKSSCYLSSLPDSHSASTLRNGEASLPDTNARRFSIGSLSDMNEQRNCGDKLKGFSKSMREDSLGKEKLGVDSLKTEVKSLKRGKSVRTIRASEHCLEARKIGNIYSDHVDDKFEAGLTENRGRRKRHEQPPENPKRQNLDDLPLKQSKSSKLSECAETNVVKSEKDSDSDFESFQVSSDEEEEEEAQLDNVNDAELDPDEEVDRKADEFIAKFREQIRLQKIASVKRFSGS